MRITGGLAKGRHLYTPKTNQTFLRPTCDRVREALFNILPEKQFKEALVLDLFAGTGSWGLEALSRGASFALFADSSLESGHLIENNLNACFSKPKAGFLQINLASVTKLGFIGSQLPSPHLCNFVFMDPPYQKKLAEPVLKVVEKAKILAPGALIVVEEHKNVSLPAQIASLHLVDLRRYGETSLWLFEYRTEPMLA